MYYTLTLVDLARHAALKFADDPLSAWGGSTNSAERSERRVAVTDNARRFARRRAFFFAQVFNLARLYTRRRRGINRMAACAAFDFAGWRSPMSRTSVTARSGSSNHAPPALGFLLRRRYSANPTSTAIYNERRRRVQPIGNTGRVSLRVKVLVRRAVSSLKQFLRPAASRADGFAIPFRRGGS